MAGSRKKNKKVIKYRRPMNIGVVFFGFIAVYLIVCVYTFFNSTHISGYEVIAGNLAADYHYTGIALRTEQVFQSEKAGYISYYAREDEKVSVNSAVYTVDESGRMAQALKDSAGELSLSEEDYNQIRSEIAVYMSNASDMNFSEVYDFKTGINATILDLMNQNMIAQLDSAEESGGIFARYNAGTSGVVEYYVDGFENASLESLSSSWFDQEAYERTNLRTEELVGQGEPVYKLITEETWKLVFPLDEEMETYLLDKIRENQKTAEDGTVIQNTTYIKIRMDKDKEELWPSVTVEYREGKAYGVLDFVNSMIRYANDRFLTFEVLIEETRGLKIPKTAVTEKEFFVIDKNYVTTSGSNNNMGVMKQTVGEDGSSQAEFVNCTIYYQDEEYAYVDPKEENFSTSEKLLQSGDMLIRTDSAEYYQVGQTAKLKGVYNINKGYTVFRQIQILYENEEYCIVKEGTSYGLSVYDHIVLNADTVNEDEVIYD
ncbi:HlyD family efflux transporter periplasmic adaptor subunit [Candidatus Merdisoma sp. JLR.KK011]|uniref:HlyD family efflux transporter periplasmic adaptor subunit n=1 Tax=Candidatus Merdisoma sp. JLR.KK011 TaxID=3114299 RepID=UPI002FF057D6